jgi:hypothetical protein
VPLNRSRNGIHDLIELETALATADTAAALREDLDNGGGVSGPAARRAIMAAAAASRFAGVPVTLAAARKLLKNEDAMIYSPSSSATTSETRPSATATA